MVAVTYDATPDSDGHGLTAHEAPAPPDVTALVVAILGGTGDQGRGLAYRLARAAQRVVIGSRSVERAEQAAAQVSAMPGVVVPVRGAANADAVVPAQVVIVAVAWEAHEQTLIALRQPLAGRIVVDCVNPLGFDANGAYPLAVPQGSAAQQASALLPDSRVCAAFHHASSVVLIDPAVTRIDQDVLVLGD